MNELEKLKNQLKAAENKLADEKNKNKDAATKLKADNTKANAKLKADNKAELKKQNVEMKKKIDAANKETDAANEKARANANEPVSIQQAWYTKLSNKHGSFSKSKTERKFVPASLKKLGAIAIEQGLDMDLKDIDEEAVVEYFYGG